MDQIKLMLKWFVGSPAGGGNSIEAISFDGSIDLPAGTFMMLAGVEFTES